MHQTYLEPTWDETNFANFYQEHASALLDYLCVQTRTLEDAEDVLVEVFLAAYRNAQIAQEIPRRQFAWLRQVAHNKMVDYYRRRGQRRELPLEHAVNLIDLAAMIDPEHALMRMEYLEQLQTALKCLSPPQQELLRLRFSEELRCSQIAIRMGKREGAIRTMLARTLKTLRGIYHVKQKEQ